MMDTLEELQYIPIKDDIRQRISAFYGVSNVFMNDVSGGGLNNEGMQIVVSNRSISYSQSVYNRLVFPQLLDAFGITEWEITLTPHEEEDEIMQLRRDEMAIRNMMQMKQSGYEAKLRDQIDDKYLNFDFREPTDEEVEAAKQEQMAAEAAKGGGGGAPPAAPVQKAYSREEAEADILNSPFSEGLGWIDENGLTEAGKDVAAQYVSEKKMCPECDVPEGDGSCSDCLIQQREEGRYEELWDE